MILLDLDGVLADFVGAACKAHGKNPDDAKRWDFFCAWGMSAHDFWKPMNSRAWWAEIPPLPWAAELLTMVAQAPVPFLIATQPNMAPGSLSGKLAWMYRHIAPGFRAYAMMPDKSRLAAPGRLLIDDSDDACRKFEKAGGEAILFPQPWNANRDKTKNRLEYVRDGLTVYFNAVLGAA